jgi:ABC-type branched-subunit amino acid transport system substrate-binding protein
MSVTRRVMVSVVAAVTLLATTVAAGGGGGSSDTGVTGDAIKVGVLVADLDGLRASGISLPDKLTTGNLASRWTNAFEEWNEAGGINGREIEPVTITWDPTDPASFEEACQQATLDEEVFMVVNANGFRGGSLPCFTVDNDTFVFFGETVDQKTLKASGKNLVVLGVPAEQSAAAAAEVAVGDGLLEKGQKVGILSSNEPSIQAGGKRLERALKRDGFDVETIEVNGLQADPAAINQEGAAAVGTFEAEDVEFVFVLLPFTSTSGFFGEAGESGSRFEYMIVDVASSSCTAFGASRTPADAAGAPCVTTWDTWALPDGAGIREETGFETECREKWDSDYGEESYPGVPSGDDLETSDGRQLVNDFAQNECTMLPLMEAALRKAGKNLTHESLHKAFLGIGDAPGALISEGEGSFTKKKPFFATKVHSVRLQPNTPDQALDANGLTYQGCPAPVNCWIPLTGEWFEVARP